MQHALSLRSLAYLATGLALVLPISPSADDGDTVVTPFVIGGEDTAEDDMPPWLANMRIREAGPGGITLLGPFCAASRIDENWAMTAAHCIMADPRESADDPAARLPLAAEELALIFDQRDLDESPTTAQVARVERWIVHPDYSDAAPDSPAEFDADIALLLLDNAPATETLSMPANSEPAGDDLMTLMGWGITEDPPADGRERPNRILQRLDDHPVVDRDECRRVWDRVTDITDNMLCAGTTEPESTDTVGEACIGDSGGPLFFTNEGGTDVQTGIVSFGIRPCGDIRTVTNEDGEEEEVRFPGVYTNIAAFGSWIAAAREAPVPGPLSLALETGEPVETVACEATTISLRFDPRGPDDRVFDPRLVSAVPLLVDFEIDATNGFLDMAITPLGDEPDGYTLGITVFDNHGNRDSVTAEIAIVDNRCDDQQPAPDVPASEDPVTETTRSGGGGGGSLSWPWALLIVLGLADRVRGRRRCPVA